MNPIVTNNDELSYEQVNALFRKIAMNDDIRLKEVDFFDVSEVDFFLLKQQSNSSTLVLMLNASTLFLSSGQ